LRNGEANAFGATCDNGFLTLKVQVHTNTPYSANALNSATDKVAPSAATAFLRRRHSGEDAEFQRCDIIFLSH
jgi:hypothetical protein